MIPHYADDWLTIYGGDCRKVLASLPSDSVDCVITSPPYWGLRDYGNEGQLGLERTPEEYVANMVAVFAEVRRVIKPSGTCWLNLGDSYAGSWGANGRGEGTNSPRPDLELKHGTNAPNRNPPGLKPKDLVGIPWRVAFALQADGWYLRSDIIWSKPNPMPESVTDRPTKSHEYLFLLTKSARYYFDADAVREPHARLWDPATNGGSWAHTENQPKGSKAGHHSGPYPEPNPAGRNIRSVWTIATRPYPGAHFAVFPPELPERCIKAGSSERGVCPECGAPWERVVERTGADMSARYERGEPTRHGTDGATASKASNVGAFSGEATTTGWRPTCAHRGYSCDCPCHAELRSHICNPAHMEATAAPAVILDPFAGSGTVGMVANRLSRRAILVDLNPEYLRQQMTRNSQVPLGLTEGDAA